MSYRPFGADSAFRPFHDYIDRTQYGGVATSTTKVQKKKHFQHFEPKDTFHGFSATERL